MSEKENNEIEFQTKYSRYVNTFENYQSIKSVNTSEEQCQKEISILKNKLEKLNDIKEICEAKQFVKEQFGVANEENYIKIGDLNCLIIDRADILQIILDEPISLTSYSYCK